MHQQNSDRLGFVGLAALVFGMMVGAGIFNLPQNMASAASLGAVALSWVITAAGMLFLVFTFKILADRHPELDAGIYQYAQKGYGNFAGFNIAWGYWLCTAFANVAYAVMLNDTLGAFFPVFLNHSWPTIIFGSALIWIIYFVVCAGIRTAKVITVALAAMKVGVILLIIALLALCVHADVFEIDLKASAGLGGVSAQVKNTMMVTLWCFIGIEGAVIMSGRARRSADVGRAGVTGFFAAWALYFLVAVLSYGVMPRERLAELEDPSVAYVLAEAVGPWAYWLVVIAIILSLTGGWVAWSLVCAEVPYAAARAGIFPRRFMRLNRKQMPAFGLMVSSVIMQLFLMLVMLADEVYLSALTVTGMMILPAYLVCGLFLWKTTRGRTRVVASGCTLFCLFTIWAGGLTLLLETSLFYLAGFGFFVRVRRERAPNAPLFSRAETVAFALLVAAAVVSGVLLL